MALNAKFSPEEQAAENAYEASRSDKNVAEIDTELARTKDPKARTILAQEKEKNLKPKEWKEVAEQDWYKKLDADRKELVKRQYFEKIVKPHIQHSVKAFGPSDEEIAWTQFKNYTEGKSPIKEPWAVEYAPSLGGAVGGVVGLTLPVPGGAVGGAAAGGAVGAMLQEGYRREHNPLAAAPDVETRIGRVVAGAGEQAAGEAVGQLGNIGVAKATAPVRAMLEPRPGAKEAQETLQRYGGSLSAGQATEMTALESIAREGILSRTQFRNLDRKNKLAIIKARNDIVDDLTSLPEEKIVKGAGETYQQAIKKGEEGFEKEASRMYSDLDADIRAAYRPRLIQAGKVTPRVDIVDMMPVKRYVGDSINAYRRRGTEPPAALTDFMKTPDRLTFADAKAKRSDLLRMARDLEKATTEKAGMNLDELKKLQGMTLDRMDSAAQRLPGNLYQKYRDVSEFYKGGREAFGDSVVVELMKKNPERVAESLFKPGNETEIQKAYAALDKAAMHDPSIAAQDVKGHLQGAWLKSRLDSRAVKDSEEGSKGKALWKMINSEKDERTFKSAFDPQQQQRIKAFADAVDLSQRGESKILHVGMPIVQGGALGYLVYAGFGGESSKSREGGAAVIVLGPEVLGIALTRPGLVNKLTGAMKIPASSGLNAAQGLIPELLELGGKIASIGTEGGKMVVKETLPTIGRTVVVPQAEQLVKEKMQ